MFSSSRTREKLLITAAMIAAVVLAGVTSKSAQAGCGHGVTSDTDRSAQRSFLDLEGLRLAVALPDGARPTLPGRKLPCAGASCSQEKGSPRVPALASSSASELWCSMPAGFVRTRPDSRELPAGPFTARAQTCTSPIERPPRSLDLS
jgi:hypothetical protein